jgi:hypothetical protein
VRSLPLKEPFSHGLRFRSPLRTIPDEISFRLLLQPSPQRLLTIAACSGLRTAPDRRPRGAFAHLLYSSTTFAQVPNIAAARPSPTPGAYSRHRARGKIPGNLLCRILAGASASAPTSDKCRPYTGGSGAPALQPAGIVCAKFHGPTPDSFVGDRDPAFEQHSLHQAQAQRNRKYSYTAGRVMPEPLRVHCSQQVNVITPFNWRRSGSHTECDAVEWPQIYRHFSAACWASLVGWPHGGVGIGLAVGGGCDGCNGVCLAHRNPIGLKDCRCHGSAYSSGQRLCHIAKKSA